MSASYENIILEEIFSAMYDEAIMKAAALAQPDIELTQNWFELLLSF